MSGYREAFGALEQKLAESIRARAEVVGHGKELARVRDARIARIAGGLTGVVGVLAWPLTFMKGFVAESAPTYWLLATALGSFAAWALTRAALSLVSRPVVGLAPQPKAEVRDEADAARSNPWPRVARTLWSLEAWALGLPLVAVSMLGPLLLHFLAYLPFALAADKDSVASSFRVWIAFAGMVVLHAHIALAAYSVRFARRLARQPTREVTPAFIHASWRNALGLAVLCAAIPGIIFIAIPPVLTALTGLALIPALYIGASRIHLRERAVVDAVDEAVSHVRVEVDEIEAAREILYGGSDGAGVRVDEGVVDDEAAPVEDSRELTPELRSARRGAS